jgi:pimeloyl-ACP methyl ester carboxylesterase
MRIARCWHDSPMTLERGVIGRLPYVALGSGAPMLFVGGLYPRAGVEAFGDRSMTSSALLRSFAKRRRILYVNRRRGLPRGMSMADLAEEHADAIRSLGGGPIDVAAISTGGSIAQELAADHPDVVDRLALISTACRLSPQTRDLQRRVAARIRRGAHRQALAVMAAGFIPPRRGQLAAAAVAWLAGPPLLARGDDLADMATTIEAEDAFDLATCRTPIRAPTLILAGGADRFYSPELFAETARLIPGSRLRVFEGRGHATVHKHPDWSPDIERYHCGRRPARVATQRSPLAPQPRRGGRDRTSDGLPRRMRAAPASAWAAWDERALGTHGGRSVGVGDLVRNGAVQAGTPVWTPPWISNPHPCVGGMRVGTGSSWWRDGVGCGAVEMRSDRW